MEKERTKAKLRNICRWIRRNILQLLFWLFILIRDKWATDQLVALQERCGEGIMGWLIRLIPPNNIAGLALAILIGSVVATVAYELVIRRWPRVKGWTFVIFLIVCIALSIIGMYFAQRNDEGYIEDTDLGPSDTLENVGEVKDEAKIAITEIMIVPAGAEKATEQHRNEYVEIYNYGTVPVSIKDLWLAVTGTYQQASKVVAWDNRNPGYFGESELLTSTAEIPPQGFALILSPLYAQNNAEQHPYKCKIAKGTIILTVDEPSQYLGGDTEIYGKGEDKPPDVVVLYIGTNENVMDNRSSYGAPGEPIDNPGSIEASNQEDGFPYPLENFGGVRKKVINNVDRKYNWEEFLWLDMTPGYHNTELSPLNGCP